MVRYLQSLRKRLLSVDFFDRIIALQYRIIAVHRCLLAEGLLCSSSFL